MLLLKKRFKKLLIYSIVELALIFVGITLSIEFSNWNDSRRKKKDELAILIEFRTSLLKDITDIRENSVGRQKAKDACKKIIHLGQNVTPYHDSLDVTFATAFLSLGINVQEAAFESLKSKGFDLISNDSLRTSIIQLYDMYFPHNDSNGKILNDLVFKTLVPFSASRFNTMSQDRMKPTNYVKLIHDTEYLYYLNVLIFYNSFLIEADAFLIDAIEQVLALLEKEIAVLQ